MCSDDLNLPIPPVRTTLTRGDMRRSALGFQSKGCSFVMRSLRIRHLLRRTLRVGRYTGAAIVMLTQPARALGPVDAAVGYQYYSGAESQTTRSPTLELDSDFKILSASLAASHFDDNQSGSAWGVTGGLKFPFMMKTRLCIAGTGFAGDSASGAWRLKAGPEFSLAIKDQTLGIFLAHYQGALGVTANALSAEFDTPLIPQLSGNAGLSLQNSDGTSGGDASVGLSWRPTDLFELSGDLGLSKNAGGLTGTLPSRRALRIEKRNQGQKSVTVTLPVAATVLLGAHVHF
jgi:hypothetical protein